MQSNTNKGHLFLGGNDDEILNRESITIKRLSLKEHCIKYARIEISLTCILPYKDRIVSENPYSHIFYAVENATKLLMNVILMFQFKYCQLERTCYSLALNEKRKSKKDV